MTSKQLRISFTGAGSNLPASAAGAADRKPMLDPLSECHLVRGNVIAGVCRVHYRATTEGGSSGSPVFNATLWEVIALHHMGGKTGMARLNGDAGTYAANEGISLLSIVGAMAG